MILIDKITKSFGANIAVNNVSLGVKSGEVLGIVGPNGSGKTTLANLLSLIISSNTGLIEIDGQNIKDKSLYDIKSCGITRTFQEVRVIEQITVMENLLITRASVKVLSSIFSEVSNKDREEASRLLHRYHLGKKQDHLAKDLSYGQRKLLEIARAVFCNSSYILLDEPYAGLFPAVVDFVSEEILKLKAEGKGIVLIEHNMDIIAQVCDRLIVMDAGRIIAEGLPKEVLARKEVIESYLGI